MIDFSREYQNPQLGCGNGEHRLQKILEQTVKYSYLQLVDKIHSLSKEEAEELLEYLKTKGIN